MRTDALSIIHKACIGSRTCSIDVSTTTFGDLCIGVVESLAVEASHA
ncbi:putative galactan 1,3-beta-galactosidase [Helianthus debilis subsp. tardiflorus]